MYFDHIYSTLLQVTVLIIFNCHVARASFFTVYKNFSDLVF